MSRNDSSPARKKKRARKKVMKRPSSSRKAVVKRPVSAQSPKDSGQGSSPVDSEADYNKGGCRSMKDSSSSSSSSSNSCLYCNSDDDDQQPRRSNLGANHENSSGAQLALYCSRGSLCSRRSRATVMSKKVPGKRKKKRRPPLKGSSLSSSSPISRNGSKIILQRRSRQQFSPSLGTKKT